MGKSKKKYESSSSSSSSDASDSSDSSSSEEETKRKRSKKKAAKRHKRSKPSKAAAAADAGSGSDDDSSDDGSVVGRKQNATSGASSTSIKKKHKKHKKQKKAKKHKKRNRSPAGREREQMVAGLKELAGWKQPVDEGQKEEVTESRRRRAGSEEFRGERRGGSAPRDEHRGTEKIAKHAASKWDSPRDDYHGRTADYDRKMQPKSHSPSGGHRPRRGSYEERAPRDSSRRKGTRSSPSHSQSQSQSQSQSHDYSDRRRYDSGGRRTSGSGYDAGRYDDDRRTGRDDFRRPSPKRSYSGSERHDDSRRYHGSTHHSRDQRYDSYRSNNHGTRRDDYDSGVRRKGSPPQYRSPGREYERDDSSYHQSRSSYNDGRYYSYDRRGRGVRRGGFISGRGGPRGRYGSYQDDRDRKWVRQDRSPGPSHGDDGEQVPATKERTAPAPSGNGRPAVKVERHSVSKSRSRSPVAKPPQHVQIRRVKEVPDDGSDENSHDWGKRKKSASAGDGSSSAEEPPVEKEKPNFALSGKLTEEMNKVNGVVIKYAEPPEARKPKRRWRLYPFKGEQVLATLYIHRQSCYLVGRDRKVCDLPIDHPSCSKQHAALQYRLVPYERDDGSTGKRVRPYIIDLESANGTFVNNKKIESKKFVELLEKDVLKFGFSSREYVLLHENSKEDEEDDDVRDEKLAGSANSSVNGSLASKVKRQLSD